MRGLALGAALALAGCAGSASSLWGIGKSPTETLDILEKQLLAAPRLSIRCDLSATGALSADLSGALVTEKGSNRAEAAWRGKLRGQPTEARLFSDGKKLVVGTPAAAADLPAPATLDATLRTNFLRAGALHDALRFADRKPPDDLKPLTVAHLSRIPEGDGARFRYGLVENGKERADEDVLVDDTGLPRERRATVHTDGGDVRVEERCAAR